MTAQISAYGRLVADPQLKTTSKGTQMAMASMAVPLPCNQADDGTATMWLSVLAFGRQADALAKHHKGELVSVALCHAGEPVDGPERRNEAGMAGYRRQRNQCANGATGRQKRPAGAGY